VNFFSGEKEVRIAIGERRAVNYWSLIIGALILIVVIE